MSVAYAVVVPHRHRRATSVTYVRRRCTVALILVLVALAAIVGGHVLVAGREGVPAPTLAARSAAVQAVGAGAPSSPGQRYLVLPGDSLWSIAEHHRGTASQTGYLQELIEVNGGTRIDVGQSLFLP